MAAKAMEKNLDRADVEDDDDIDADDAPIFTPELARLKAREAGKPIPADAAADKGDAEMSDDPDEAKETNNRD